MSSIEDFAAELLRRYGADLKAGARRIIEGDFHAGEWEVAAIFVIEVAANVTPQELAELAAFAADFDPIDAKVAALVIAKRRGSCAA